MCFIVFKVLCINQFSIHLERLRKKKKKKGPLGPPMSTYISQFPRYHNHNFDVFVYILLLSLLGQFIYDRARMKSRLGFTSVWILYLN